jgi:hypothetical protein
MRRAAVQSAGPRTSSLIVGRGVPLAEVAVGIANVRHVKCIAPPVRAVVERQKYLFSRAATGPCIAVNVINRNVTVARTTEDRVGNVHDRDFGKAR